MAMNLRLDAESQQALRVEAERSGRSQQEIVREAIGRHLRLVPDPPPAPTDQDALIASGTVHPPRREYRRVVPSVSLPRGLNTLDLLDREDRV
jgi:hypothetical protein